MSEIYFLDNGKGAPVTYMDTGSPLFFNGRRGLELYCVSYLQHSNREIGEFSFSDIESFGAPEFIVRDVQAAFAKHPDAVACYIHQDEETKTVSLGILEFDTKARPMPNITRHTEDDLFIAPGSDTIQ